MSLRNATWLAIMIVGIATAFIDKGAAMVCFCIAFAYNGKDEK